MSSVPPFIRALKPMALKMIALAMAILPGVIDARRKRDHLRLVASDGNAPPAMAEPLPSRTPIEKTKAEEKPITVKSRDGMTTAIVRRREETLSPDAAIAEFLEMMIECGGGGSLQFRHVARNYREIGAAAGWPPLSDKALSSRICARGCKKRLQNKREKDGHRPTIITFPTKPRKRAA